MSNPKVLMVQTMPNRWKLQTENGVILQEDICLHNSYSADIYAKNYVSSFQSWTYEVVPLKKPGKKDE